VHDAELETTIALAKSAPERKTKSEWYAELRKHANRRRLPGETIEKAFAKFITDPDGIPLYKAYKATRGPSLSGSDIDGPDAAPVPDPDAVDGGSDGLKRLRAIANSLRAKDASLSHSAAMARAMKTPEGMKAALEDRRSRIGV
jgi:hypothetical protein